MLIQLYPSNKLLQKNSDIKNFDESLKSIVTEMSVLMRKLNGVGLAAPQVGINQKFFIMELEGEPFSEENPLKNLQVVINPKIIALSLETNKNTEGCLSLPGIFEKVTRHNWVEVEFKDLNGNKIKKKFFARNSRCFQHEFEHLQGEIFIKHFSALKRDIVKRKMSKINSLLGNS